MHTNWLIACICTSNFLKIQLKQELFIVFQNVVRCRPCVLMKHSLHGTFLKSQLNETSQAFSFWKQVFRGKILRPQLITNKGRNRSSCFGLREKGQKLILDFPRLWWWKNCSREISLQGQPHRRKRPELPRLLARSVKCRGCLVPKWPEVWRHIDCMLCLFGYKPGIQ